MGDLGGRWWRSLGLPLVVPVLLAALGGGVAVAADGGPGQGLSVTVPELRVVAHDDELWVGPWSSRLDVLANDTGPVDRSTLALVGPAGRTRIDLGLGSLGRVRVDDGALRLDPRPRAHGTGSFRYRVTLPDRSGVAEGVAVVRLFDPVLVLADDQAATKAGTPVAVDVAANDRLVVDGAETPCGPILFAHPPSTAHPVPLVLPEPARAHVTCAEPSVLSTKDGRWTARADGTVLFAPDSGFRGTARAYYRQTSGHPFDLRDAQMTVEVGRGGTAVLGEQHGPHGGGGAQGGPIPRTGAMVGGALVVGLALVLVGLRLRRRGALVR